MRMITAGTIVDDGTALVAQTRLIAANAPHKRRRPRDDALPLSYGGRFTGRLDRYRISKHVACIEARRSHQQLAAVHAEPIHHLRRGTKRASA
jgi:hypothetical protein